MQKVEENPSLSLDAIKLIWEEESDLFVNSFNWHIGRELLNYLTTEYIKENKESGKSDLELAELFKARLIISEDLPDKAWKLVTPKEEYYSKGDCSK